MNPLIIVTFFEMSVLLVYGYFLAKRPAVVGLVSVVLFAVVFRVLQETYVNHLLDIFARLVSKIGE